MNKYKFRVLVIFSMLLGFFGGTFDLFWPNPEIEELLKCQENTNDEFFESNIVLVGFISVIGVMMVIVSFFGLLRFWNPARHIYLAGYIIFLPISTFFRQHNIKRDRWAIV